MSAVPDPSVLSLREKAAQLVFPRIGSNIPPRVRADDDFERVARLLDAYPIGGLILFNGDLRTTPRILRELQERSRFPLLVATDMEAGLGQQLEGATVFPHAMAFSQTGQDAERYVASAAQTAAREALAAGVQIALAPVADVHRNPNNPIISIRAFNSDPREAARLAAAYVRALQAEGMSATAKHFPGHGGTTDDSHAVLPVVPDSREEWEQSDLIPFLRCIEAGVDVVMTAHVAFSALDPVNRPATISPDVIGKLLRRDLGFDGVVMTDSMMMEGVRQSAPDPGARFVAAGGDVVLDPVDPAGTIEEIVRAVESGNIAEAALDSAVRRVGSLRSNLLTRFGESVFRDPSSLFEHAEMDSSSGDDAALTVARAALTVSDADHPILTSLRSRSVRSALAVVPSLRSAALTGPLLEEMRTTAPDIPVYVVESDGVASTEGAGLQKAELVVLVLLVRPAAWHAYGLSQDQERFVNEVLQSKKSVLAMLGSDDVLRRFNGADVTLGLHSDMEPSQRVLVRYLFDS